MEIRLDLHVHSRRSPDGIMDIGEIVSLGKARGLHGVAVCDHDLVQAEPPSFDGFLVIPGTEVSTRLGHLLGLFVTEPVETRDFFDAVDAIHAQGGLAVLAHPFEHGRDGFRLLPAVPLLDGIETWNSRADRKVRDANALALGFARAHGLRPFGGSDAHCPEEIGNGFTAVEAEELTPDAVKSALLAGNAEAGGRRSKALYTARSRLAKLDRTGAGPWSYARWAAFAAGCGLRDLLRKGG